MACTIYLPALSAEAQTRLYISDCLEHGRKINRKLIRRAVTFSKSDIERFIRQERAKFNRRVT